MLEFTKDIIHKIVVKFTANHLPEAKKPYTLRAKFQPELDVDGVAAKAVLYNLGISPKTIVEGLKGYCILAYYLLADGYRLKNPLCTIYARMPGEYDGNETSLAEGKRPELRMQTASELRKYIAEKVEVVFDGIDQRDGLIAEALDEKTGMVDDVVTIGNLLTIRGYGLKIESDEQHKAQMGVFFQPAAGGLPLKAEIVAVNEPRTLKIIAPPALSAGTAYYLRVFTQSSAHGSSTLLKEVRDMKSDFQLTAQA
jgi:hypothetical protein